MNAAAGRVIVFIACELSANRGPDLQFLQQLPGKRLLRRFAVLDFAARKLPLQWMAIASSPLSHQNPPVAVDDARRDEQGCAISHR